MSDDAVKKKEKFKILSEMFGGPTSMSELILGKKKARGRRLQHEDIDRFQSKFRNYRKDYRPRDKYNIFTKKVPSIQSMIEQEDKPLKLKKGDFVTAKCKLGKNKPTRLT